MKQLSNQLCEHNGRNGLEQDKQNWHLILSLSLSLSIYIYKSLLYSYNIETY